MADPGSWLNPQNIGMLLAQLGQGSMGSAPGAAMNAAGGFMGSDTGRDLLFGAPGANIPFPVGQSMGDPSMQPMIGAGAQLGSMALGLGAPFAARGALGMAGGKMAAAKSAPKMQTITEIDAELANSLKGTDIHPMDMVGKWGQENAPQAARDVWAKREALEQYVDNNIDAKLKKMLGEEKFFDVVAGFGPAEARQVTDPEVKALLAERSRLWGD